jgi:hypothetical protein
LLLAILYGCFALLLSRETFHRFNRLVLLGVLVASVVLPAIHLKLKKPSYLSYEEVAVPHIVMIAEPNPNLEQDITTPKPILPEPEETVQVPTFRIDIVLVIKWLYFFGILASLAIFFLQIFRLLQEIRGGVYTKDEFGNTVVIQGGDFAPYSFLHYIIISASDYEHLRRPILAHEQAHIRFGHTYDLLLLEMVKAIQWFNPFVYLLGRDLKTVHEYEADNAVLNFGIDAKTYQLLLVTKAVGSRLQTVCNNLSHHSLKNRIKMMHTHKSNCWLMSKGLVLPALMALALVAFAKPKTNAEDKAITMAMPGEGFVKTDAVKGIEEIDVTEKNPGKLLKAFIVSTDAPERLKKQGNGIVVTWHKGTWVQTDDNSFIEEHPVCTYPWIFREKHYKLMLDGKELDIKNLPDLPASALKKMEVSLKNHSVNLITKPVQVPAGIKGNINPELTILLTGTPPKDSGAKTSIWTRGGIFDGFSWKNYTICSWKWDVDDVGQHLEEVAIRKDHYVRINVCKGVPQEHIDRIKRIMQEKGVTNYKLVRQ